MYFRYVIMELINENRGRIMASSKDYLDFILGQLSELEEITYRAMMGEFIIYYRSKIVGGIYDDRLLVKPVKSAISYMPTVLYELPYKGAKEMLLVDEVDNKEFLAGLFNAMYEELPEPKPKKKKSTSSSL
jgi:TfoX/Sxy family transcriptional regulator of competence genes